MRIYELMYITDPRIPEEAREAGVEKVKKVIEEKVGGTIEKIDRWGVRKLAYKLPKSKLTEGDYTVILFRSEGTSLSSLENLFQVTPEFIRKQVVRREDIEKLERAEMLKKRREGTAEVEETVEVVEVTENEEPEFEVEKSE